jgi:RNA polymerase sigma factor (TIGR02999 family)
LILSSCHEVEADVAGSADIATPRVTPGADDAMEGSALFGELYDQLKQMAHRELSKSGSHTLNTTGLVHELYLKVCAGREIRFGLKPQFYMYAASAIRHILIDRARRRLGPTFGGSDVHVSLGDLEVGSAAVSSQQALQLDAALTSLQAANPRAARVVELHYFAGLALQDVAEMLGLVRRTVDRDWRFARSYLTARIG